MLFAIRLAVASGNYQCLLPTSPVLNASAKCVRNADEGRAALYQMTLDQSPGDFSPTSVQRRFAAEVSAPGYRGMTQIVVLSGTAAGH
jgi:hypothetical protein